MMPKLQISDFAFMKKATTPSKNIFFEKNTSSLFVQIIPSIWCADLCATWQGIACTKLCTRKSIKTPLSSTVMLFKAVSYS